MESLMQKTEKISPSQAKKAFMIDLNDRKALSQLSHANERRQSCFRKLAKWNTQKTLKRFNKNACFCNGTPSQAKKKRACLYIFKLDHHVKLALIVFSLEIEECFTQNLSSKTRVLLQKWKDRKNLTFASQESFIQNETQKTMVLLDYMYEIRILYNTERFFMCIFFS